MQEALREEAGTGRWLHRQPATRAGVAAVVLLLLLLLPTTGQPYWMHVATVTWFYALMASSWALLAGYAGQFSFAHMALATLAAYTSGLLVEHAGLGLVPAALAGVVAASVFGAAIAWLCLRMSGPYLALFTLAFSEIFRIALMAEYRFTRGSLGLHVPPWFGGTSKAPYYYAGLGLLLLGLGAMYLLTRSRAGLFWKALRENERSAAACGVDVVRYRVRAATAASAIAGVAGVFYGHYVGILTPNLAEVSQMGLVVAMAVVGGVESLIGAVVGAAFLEILSEALRDYGQWRFVLFGAVLVLTQRYARDGLVVSLLKPGAGRMQPSAQRSLQPGAQPDVQRSVQPRAHRGGEVPDGGRAAGGAPLRGGAPVLRVEGLVKRFGGIVAVNGVSLSVWPGERIGLIGPNGSGKSTLLALIGGELAPDAGTIEFAGRRLDALPAYVRARLGVGRTFQITQPFRRMTVLENLLVAGLTRPGAGRRQVEVEAWDILRFLGLAHLAGENARALSGGQQKLLEIGRLLMLQPTLLLLDEPFAGVSRAMLDELIELLLALHRAGKTLIIVDHDMEAVQRVATRLVVMARGQKLADGPADSVRHDPAVVAAYVGAS